MLQKRSFLEVQTSCNVVSGVALCGIATCFTYRKSSQHVSERVKSRSARQALRDRRNAFARFSEDDLHFSWQAQHFGDVHRHFAWQARHFRRVVLRFSANRIVGAASSGDNVQIAWQAWDIVRVVLRGRRSIW